MDGLGTIQGITFLNIIKYFLVDICYALDFLQITYTSDYFQDLYELAVELIQRGHAYVDHQVLMHDNIHNLLQQMHTPLFCFSFALNLCFHGNALLT